MKKLLMLAVAAMALAIPASASATGEADFLHDGNVVTETTEVVFTGTAQFVSEEAGTVHCPTIHATVDLFANGTGEVTDFDGINCLLNGAIPVDDNAIEPHSWIVEAKSDGTIEITGVEIHNVYTHPITGEPIGTSLLQANVKATPVGDAEATSHYTLGGTGLVNGSAHATIEGTLKSENTATETTEIGVR